MRAARVSIRGPERLGGGFGNRAPAAPGRRGGGWRCGCARPSAGRGSRRRASGQAPADLRGSPTAPRGQRRGRSRGRQGRRTCRAGPCGLRGRRARVAPRPLSRWRRPAPGPGRSRTSRIPRSRTNAPRVRAGAPRRSARGGRRGRWEPALRLHPTEGVDRTDRQGGLVGVDAEDHGALLGGWCARLVVAIGAQASVEATGSHQATPSRPGSSEEAPTTKPRRPGRAQMC
jgi:hypothetical protein